MSKRTIASIIIFVAALLFLALSFNVYKNLSASKEAPPRAEPLAVGDEGRGIQVRTVSNKDIKSGFSAQGRLRAYDKTDIVAEVPGMTLPTEKKFKIGSRYKKGELMISLDDTEPRIALSAQKAQLQTAITQMLPDMKIDMPGSFNNWKAYLDRFDLKRPIQEFPKPLSDRESYYVSTRGLHAQFYNIKTSEHRLTKYRVYAPFDGVLTAATINEGGFARAGVPLGNLMNSYSYEMEAEVLVGDLKYIKTGSSVKVVSDDSGKSWTGKVRRIGDQINPSTQTATVYVAVSGAGLREGQYLRAIINTSAINKASELPRKLLVGQDRVYVVEDSLLRLKAVNIVKIEGENAIVKGLDDGDLLLAAPVGNAYEGMRVKW